MGFGGGYHSEMRVEVGDPNSTPVSFNAVDMEFIDAMNRSFAWPLSPTGQTISRAYDIYDFAKGTSSSTYKVTLMWGSSARNNRLAVSQGKHAHPAYQVRCGLTAQEGRQAFEWLIDGVMDHWKAHLDRTSTISPHTSVRKRPIGRYATRESQIDQLLRAGCDTQSPRGM